MRRIHPFFIGAVASLADAWLFSNLWNGLDWRQPVAEWLAGIGFVTLAGWFGLVWIRVPTFVIAVILGVMVARLFSERWISALCFCALGFVGASLLLTLWFCGLGRAALWALEWSAVSVALLLFGAWPHLRRRTNSAGLSTGH